MTDYLLFGITYAFACVVQPGPFQAFLISQSLTNGRRRTIPLVFAPLLSDLPVIILVLLVLTHIPPGILSGLQCLGGIFLCYLAWNAFRNWRNFKQSQKPEVPSRQTFSRLSW